MRDRVPIAGLRPGTHASKGQRMIQYCTNASTTLLLRAGDSVQPRKAAWEVCYICCHCIQLSISLYTYTCFPAYLSSFFSLEVFKEFAQCIGNATCTGLIADCTKITQHMDKYFTANRMDELSMVM